MTKQHKLKSWPTNFEALLAGRRHDIRKADRDFNVGDSIFFEEYKTQIGTYTGRHLERKVTTIQVHDPRGGTPGLEAGYVVLGLN